MAKKTIKMRTKLKGDLVEVKALMKHPMETGRRKDGDGKTIPAHYITEVTVTANDNIVLSCDWGGTVSKDPYLSFKYKGAEGDKVKLTWVDNTEKTESVESTVKGKKKKKS